MSALILLKLGSVRKCKLETNHAVALGDLFLGLYVNNITPTPDDDGSTYIECSLPGYAQVDLVGANWSNPAYAAQISSTVYPDVVFTFTAGGQTIYGLFLVLPGSSIGYAALLDTPFTVPGGGGTLTIHALTLQNKNC